MLSQTKKHMTAIVISFIFAVLVSKHVESFSAYPVKALYFTVLNKK
jgi:hypothetical protein